MTGALWTPTRMIDAGYLVGGVCALCGLGTDDIYHRIWMCPSSAAERTAHGGALNTLRQMELSGRMPGMLHAFVAATRGIIPDVVGGPGPAQPECHLVATAAGMMPQQWTHDAADRIYTDGSCRQERCLGKPAAGYAIIALTQAGLAAGSGVWVRAGALSAERRGCGGMGGCPRSRTLRPMRAVRYGLRCSGCGLCCARRCCRPQENYGRRLSEHLHSRRPG